MMMEVTLKLFASLRKYSSGSSEALSVSLTGQPRVLELLEQCGVPVKEAPIVLVNGIRVAHDHKLANGDNVSIFPLIGGG